MSFLDAILAKLKSSKRPSRLMASGQQLTLARDCGATTSEYMYMAVNLQDLNQKRLDVKNEVFVVKHVHRLHLFWQGNDSLTVERSFSRGAFARENS
jgi:hypothetical protein